MLSKSKSLSILLSILLVIVCVLMIFIKRDKNVDNTVTFANELVCSQMATKQSQVTSTVAYAQEEQAEPVFKVDYFDYTSYIVENFSMENWEVGSNGDDYWLIYKIFPYSLSEARTLMFDESFQSNWISFTNQVYKLTQSTIFELRNIGFTGSFKMIIMDVQGEIIYMATEDLWGDSVYDKKGSILR